MPSPTIESLRSTSHNRLQSRTGVEQKWNLVPLCQLCQQQYRDWRGWGWLVGQDRGVFGIRKHKRENKAWRTCSTVSIAVKFLSAVLLFCLQSRN